MVEGVINRPDTSAGTKIQHPLRLVNRSFVEIPVGDEQHDLVVDIQPILLHLVRWHHVLIGSVVGVIAAPWLLLVCCQNPVASRNLPFSTIHCCSEELSEVVSEPVPFLQFRRQWSIPLTSGAMDPRGVRFIAGPRVDVVNFDKAGGVLGAHVSVCVCNVDVGNGDENRDLTSTRLFNGRRNPGCRDAVRGILEVRGLFSVPWWWSIQAPKL